MSVSVWEAVFMLLVLKIPVIYLAIVVWWAIRAEPPPDGGQEPVHSFIPLTPCGWDDWRRRRARRLTGHRPFSPTGRPSPRARLGVPA